jgi:glutaconate CoA-transferase, subunit B
MNATPRYNLTELLACAAAGLLEDGRSAFVGTGFPIVAGMLAQRTHAPGLLIIFEAGGIGPRVPVLPISVGGSRTYYKASAASSMHDVMSAAQAGYVDYGFLGGAAMDRYGNINTTVIGDWKHPKARLPGSGGASDVGSNCWQTIVVMRKQSKQTFVNKLDFLTTPGYLSGPGARERAGLPAGSGPYRVITQLGIYGFDDVSKCLTLLSLHPGVTVEQVQEASEFEILVPAEVGTTPEPQEEQLRILRQIDPQGLVIGK